MNTIYTMGYGRTTKEAFQERLRVVHRKVGDRLLIVVDVRREHSLSWNGEWCYHSPRSGNKGLVNTINSLGQGYAYNPRPKFANDYGDGKKGLEAYRHYLNGLGVIMEDFVNEIDGLWKDGNRDVYVLLCAERQPFKSNGMPNCHRLSLAEKLMEELGEGWEVKHL